MKIGMIGLGRMGGDMARRLLERGHQVVAFDRSETAVISVEANGADGVGGLPELVTSLERPRAVWVMVPAGDPTATTIQELSSLLAPGDVIVDGGNSHYRDAQRRSAELAEHGIDFVDAGVSGGVWGREEGYCLMVGGAVDAVARLEPAFEDLAPRDGYAHVGPSGAGHFAKMVHNGIEYGLMQAYAEGFALLDAAPELIDDVHGLVELWQHGSVVRSWLLELASRALADEQGFARVSAYVEDSGEGRWTVNESVARAVPTPTITAALYERFSSRDTSAYAARLLAALRNQFGGHRVFGADEGTPTRRRALAAGVGERSQP